MANNNLSATISVVDRVTPALQTMSGNVDRLTNNMRTFDATATRNLNNFSNNVRNSGGLVDGLKNKIIGLVGAFGAFELSKSVVNTSDELTNIRSRLDLMNDGLQTTDDLQKKIMASSNSTFASYKDTADMVSKLGNLAGNAFSNNQDIINFAEQVNKLFTIAGTSSTGKQAVMLQLTQALAGGVLRGEEFNSVLENAPTIAGAIAKSLGVNVGKLREMAGQGQLTSELVKTAIFQMADETNAKFDQMDLTFGDLWTKFKNGAIASFQLLFDRIRELVNSKGFKTFLNDLAHSLQLVSSVIVGVIDLVGTVATYMKTNWQTIAPIIIGVVAPLLAIKGALIGIWAWQKIMLVATSIWNGLKVAIGGVQLVMYAFTNATKFATLATTMFNSAWLMSPITWIILGIVAVIGVLVGALYYMTGSWEEVLSYITGGLTSFSVFVLNTFGYIYNIFASVAEFFMNVWTNPTYSVKKLFGGLINNMIDMVMSFGDVWLDMINSMISVFTDAYNWIAEKIGGDSIAVKLEMNGLKSAKKGIEQWIGDAPTDYKEIAKFDFMPMQDAFNIGQKWGKGAYNKIADLFKFTDVEQANKSSEELLKNSGNNGKGATDLLGDISKNTKATANNTGDYQAELKYLRDIAEREAINRFTTAEISVNMQNTNNISGGNDINTIIKKLTDSIYNSLNSVAEQVHM